ncbi:MAG: hypothetical protein D3925_05540 [Candidatus Electrothrix sp. AR5]|nr:hypothetical protein [Candidatus Electrothrix sp. AR5]
MRLKLKLKLRLRLRLGAWLLQKTKSSQGVLKRFFLCEASPLLLLIGIGLLLRVTGAFFILL